MNLFHIVIEHTLPYIISFLEIIAIFIVVFSALNAFVQYVKSAFVKNKPDVKSGLANGLAFGLEFAMSAEILKTILVQSWDDILMLGAIIVLRISLSLLIHFESHALKGEAHNQVIHDNEEENHARKEEIPSKEEA